MCVDCNSSYIRCDQMTRLPDPATKNPVLHKMLNVYFKGIYKYESVECPLEDLLKYDYLVNNLKVEVKIRHFVMSHTDPKYYNYDDVLVEYEQHSGHQDGWFYECQADRLLVLKILYNKESINPFSVKSSDISEFKIYDISWQELKEICKKRRHRETYSGKTTGSWNWVVDLNEISDKKIFKIKI